MNNITVNKSKLSVDYTELHGMFNLYKDIVFRGITDRTVIKLDESYEYNTKYLKITLVEDRINYVVGYFTKYSNYNIGVYNSNCVCITNYSFQDGLDYLRARIKKYIELYY